MNAKDRERLERLVPKVCESYAFAVGKTQVRIKHLWNQRKFVLCSNTTSIEVEYTSAFRSARIREGVESAIHPIIMKRYSDPVVEALCSERGRAALVAQLNIWASGADEYIRDEVAALWAQEQMR